MEPIELLPVNKTVQYETTITPEFLVRTGTIPEIFDSLVNCFLQGCSKKFVADTLENKKKTISLTRELIKRKYFQSSTFIDFHNLFLDKLYKLISDFYSYMSTKNEDNISEDLKDLLFILFKEPDPLLIDLYMLICKIIPLNSGGVDRIIKNCSKLWNHESNKDELRDIFLSEVNKFVNYNEIFENIPIEKANYIKENVNILFNSIMMSIFNSIVSPDFTLKTINAELLDTMKHYFKSNVIFIDTVVNLPFLINDYDDELKSLLVLSHDMKHFEIIGKLLEKNRIQREFTFNDNFFYKIHQMITIKKNI
jgi:hypothetical protein